MKQLIYKALTESPEIQEMFDGGVYQYGSLGHNGVPAIPPFRFLLIFEQPSTSNREVRRTRPSSHKRNFNIMAYDEIGAGYLQIEQGLYVVRDTLVGLAGQVSPSGARCTDALWSGFSVDSKDVDYQASVKWGTFSFVTSQ
jgi:hypothetical protein